MKKTLLVALAIILALSMGLGLAACGGGGGGGSSAPPQNVFSPPPAAPPPAPPPSSGGTAVAPDLPAAPDPGTAGPPKSDNEPVHNFTWAHPYPASHHHHADIIMPFVERVREASDGTININVVPGGAITTGPTAVDDVTTGAVDLTWTLTGNTPGRFPLLSFVEFVDHFDSGMEATMTIWGMLYESETFRNEFRDYKLFNIYTTETGEIYTIDEVRRPADLAGMPLRAASPLSQRMMVAFGAVTVGMAMPDVYDNLERGVIVGLGTSPSAIPTYNLNEIVNHGTVGLNLYVTPQIMMMSWRAWAQLSPWQQYIFDSLSGLELSLISAQYYDDLAADALRGIEGMSLNVLTAAERAEFDAVSQNVIAEYKAEVDALGYDSQAHYDMMIRIRNSFR